MKIKLPEREHYTVDEVCERWRCTKDDMRHLILTNVVVPSIFVGDPVVPFDWRVSSASSNFYDDVVRELEHVPGAVRRGFYSLPIWTQTAALDGEAVFVTEPAVRPEGDRIEGFLVRRPGYPYGLFFLSRVMNEGVILVPDLEKAEDELRGGLPASADAPIGARERTNLLNIIGGLLAVIGGKQEALISDLITRYPGVPGIAARTLQQKFAAAKKSLDAN